MDSFKFYFEMKKNPGAAGNNNDINLLHLSVMEKKLLHHPRTHHPVDLYLVLLLSFAIFLLLRRYILIK